MCLQRSPARADCLSHPCPARTTARVLLMVAVGRTCQLATVQLPVPVPRETCCGRLTPAAVVRARHRWPRRWPTCRWYCCPAWRSGGGQHKQSLCVLQCFGGKLRQVANGRADEGVQLAFRAGGCTLYVLPWCYGPGWGQGVLPVRHGMHVTVTGTARRSTTDAAWGLAWCSAVGDGPTPGSETKLRWTKSSVTVPYT